MQGDKSVIRLLNQQLTNELTAINQYFLHARMFRHWGLEAIGKTEHDESIGEMRHADKLIARILVLDGLPNLQDLHKLNVGENVPEAIAADLALERASQSHVKDAIAQCEKVRDFVTRAIFEEILADTEEHIDWIETQLELIGKIGLQNYLQSQMGDPS